MANAKPSERPNTADASRRLLQYRIVIELASPLAIASGASDDLFDAPCARDANGLPAIPGTSLTGALRSLWLRQFNEASANEWFGMIEPSTDAGKRSRLLLSWAHVHGANNRAIDGIVAPTTIMADAVLSQLVQLPRREHVRLDHRGGAFAKAKFDRSFVPTGCRFSFDLRLFTTADQCQSDVNTIDKLLQMMLRGHLWLGGAKSGGYGRTKIESIKELIFDLTQKGARKAVQTARSLTGDLPKESKGDGIWHRAVRQGNSALGFQRMQVPPLMLTLRDTWRIGTGENSVAKLKDPAFDKKSIVALPYTEACLDWKQPPAPHDRTQQSWVTQIVVPGSAIRGALAHRTTFHFNRLQRRWATCLAAIPPDTEPPATGNVAASVSVLDVVEVLFGSVKTRAVAGSAAKKDTSGHAGAVFVEDQRIPIDANVKIVQLPHVRIDRFTGGAFGGALFSEELLFDSRLPLALSIDETRLHGLAKVHGSQTAKTALLALDDAVRDLCEARLPIGAGGAHGHGYCRGEWPAALHPTLQLLVDTLPKPAAVTATEEVTS